MAGEILYFESLVILMVSGKYQSKKKPLNVIDDSD